MSKNKTKKPAQTGTEKKKGFHLHLTTTIITVLLTILGFIFFRLGFTTNYYVYGEMNSTLIQWLLIGAVVSAIAAVVLTKAFPKAFWPKWITFVTTGLLAAAALILIGDRVEGIGNCIMTDYDSGHGGEEAIYYSLGGAVAMLIAMIYNIIGSFREESDAPAGKGKTLALSISAGVLSVATIVAILGLVGVDLTGGTSIGPGGMTTGEKAAYSITYNMNNENLDSIQTYQFLSGDLSGMLHYDARFYVDMNLELDGQGNYTLTSDAYCVENGKRAAIGDDTGLGMNLKTTAEGTYVENADGTITTSAATHASHQMEMDTYSQQMKGAAQMNVGGNDADGIYDSRDTEAVLAFVPATVWTVDKESKTILGYKKAPLSGTFTITYNMNNENLDGIQTYQFLSGDLSGMLHYDARFYIDYTLKLENGIYELTSDAYCVENGKRAEIGDDTGLGMILKTTAEGLYTANDDETITTHIPTHAVHEMQMDTYSQQMKGAAQMNVGGNDADGTYDSNSEPAVLDMVPETVWTLDESGAILGYKEAPPSGTFTISLNMNNENLDVVTTQQFLSGDLSGMLHYDARFFVDLSLTLDGGENYVLVSDAYCVENGSRAVIGDDTGLGMNLKTTAEGTYVVNEDGMVTTHPATHAVHVMEMDTYSQQMKGAAQMNVGGNDADGTYDSADTPAVLDFVPEVTWTLDNGKKTIVAYAVASEEEEAEEETAAAEEAAVEEAPAETEAAAEEVADAAEAAVLLSVPSTDGGTTAIFYDDATFVFDFSAYSIQEVGTWNYTDGRLTVTNPNGLEATAEGDPLQLHYVSAASDQLVGDYEIPADSFEGGTEVPLEEGAPVEEEKSADEVVSVTIPSDDEGTTMTFNSDGTYRFFFEAYSVEDLGTYTYADGVLTLTDVNGLQYTAEGDPLKLHYGFSGAPDQLTGEYTIPADTLDF